MRTYTNSGITITYPEQFLLSGNRNIVTISGATTKTTFSLFGDERELSAGAGQFNLLPYMQSAFATVGKNEMFSPLSITENLLLDGVNFKALDFTQVHFGANEFGDKRTLVQYAEYTEFSPWFQIWLPTDMEAEINDVAVELVAGFNNIDLSSYTGDVLIQLSTSGFDSFDDTFDETFTGEIIEIYVKRVSCPENGMLMRWLDHWGIWQQKTFARVSLNRSSKKESYNWNGQNSNILYSGLKFSEVTRSQSFEVTTMAIDKKEAFRVSELVDAQFSHAYDFETSNWLPCIVLDNESKPAYNKGVQTINFNISLQNGY